MTRIRQILWGPFALLLLGTGCDFFDASNEISCDAIVRCPLQRSGVWEQLNVPENRIITAFDTHACNANIAYLVTLDVVEEQRYTIHQSTDCGTSWESLHTSTERFWGIVTYEAEPNVLYGLAENLSKSTDGGYTWNVIAPALTFGTNFANSLSIDPTSPNRLFAGVGSSPFVTGDVYRSLNAGHDWQLVPEVPPTLGQNIIKVVTTEIGVYAVTSEGGLLSSQDDGETWALVSSERLRDFAMDTRAPYTMITRTWNEETNMVVLARSLNLGRTWLPLGGGLPDTGRFSNLLLSPMRNRVYLGLSESISDSKQPGIYILEHINQDTTWTRIPNTYFPFPNSSMQANASGIMLFIRQENTLHRLLLEE